MPRSENFSKDDESILVNICESFLDVIENLKTDHISNKEKEIAWNKISQLFNVATTSGKRESKQLKTKWQNLKYRTKNDYSERRVQILKTGGGPPPPCEEPILQKVYGLVGPQKLTVESENMISTQAAGAAVTLSSEVPLLDDSLSEVSWRIDQTEIALVKANSSTVEAVILPTVYKSRILVSAKMIEPTEIRHTLILRNLSVSDSGSLVQSQWNFESEEFVLNVKYCDKSSNGVAAGTIVQPEQCSFGCTATMDCDKEYYSESFMYNVSTTCLENAEWSKNIKCRRLEVTDRPRDAAIAVAVIAILWTLCTGIWIRMLCKRPRLSKCKVAFEITLDVILLAASMALLLAMDWNVSGSLSPGGIAGLAFGIFAVASPLICIYPLSKGFFDDTTAASDAKPSIPIQEVMY